MDGSRVNYWKKLFGGIVEYRGAKRSGRGGKTFCLAYLI